MMEKYEAGTGTTGLTVLAIDSHHHAGVQYTLCPGLEEKGETMLISYQGATALRALRVDLQESAGRDFPQSQLDQLLLLYDVCKYLKLNWYQAQYVMGASAFTFVTDYINSPRPLLQKNGQQSMAVS